MAKKIRIEVPENPPRTSGSYTLLDRPKKTFEEFRRDLLDYKLRKELGLV